MGDLVAKRYPAKLFANLADHTYVECGTGGKGWACWGGKNGGTELRRATGSTIRANEIAEPDEHAGITCYLINGVCHQAANRILLPASITVRGARGYEVSEALFGTYGRPGGFLGMCSAPFDQHSGTVGDSPECTAVAMKMVRRKRTGKRRLRTQPRTRVRVATPAERKYLKGVLAIYQQARRPLRSAMHARKFAAGRDLVDFHLELFMHQVDYKLDSRVDRKTDRRLREIRRSTERSRQRMEQWLVNRHMTPVEFAHEFDAETKVFQHALAGALKSSQYSKLLALPPDSVVTLADPRIVRRVFKKNAFKR